jgi:hypothetical protein
LVTGNKFRATQASHPTTASVKFDHTPASGILMQMVYILGDDFREIPKPLHFRQGHMPRVRSSLLQEGVEFQEHCPDFLWFG